MTYGPSTLNNELFSVTAISPQAFWATGYENLGVAPPGPAGGIPQTLTELYCAHVIISGPSPAYVGEPFSLTVTAQNPIGTTNSVYRGTLHFTSSDSRAVLPADYTFTTGDAGTHVFTGVAFNTPGTVTITATDPISSYVIGAGTFTVTCNGVCPAPGGTAGGRGTMPGTPGTAGSRDASQSGASSSGPRLPRVGLLPQHGDARAVPWRQEAEPDPDPLLSFVVIVSGLIVLP
jgi:hypothetical protein